MTFDRHRIAIGADVDLDTHPRVGQRLASNGWVGPVLAAQQ